MLGLLGLGHQFGLHELLQLVGLDLAVDDGLEAVAEELEALVMLEDRGIPLEDAAFLGLHHVLLERDQAVAAPDHEDLIEQLQQLRVLLARGRLAGDRRLGLVEDFLQHMARARDDEHAERDAEDDDELRDVQQHQRLAAGEHEPAQGRRQDDEGSD